MPRSPQASAHCLPTAPLRGSCQYCLDIGKAGQEISGPRDQSRRRGPGGESDCDAYSVVASILCLPPGPQTLLHGRGPARQGESSSEAPVHLAGRTQALAQTHVCVEGTPPSILPRRTWDGQPVAQNPSLDSSEQEGPLVGSYSLCPNQLYLGNKEPNPAIEFKILLLSSGWLVAAAAISTLVFHSP